MKNNISEKIGKINEWLIYISVIIVPLIFLPQVNSVFAEPKLYVFRVITVLIILLWGVKCLLDDKFKVRFSKFFWFVIGYAAVSLLNTFFTINVYTSLFGTYGRFLGVFTIINLLFWIYIVFSFINTKEKIIKLMWFSVITAFVVAFYGLLQYFNLFVNIIPWSMDPMDRVFSTIGHSNHTAAYLGMNLMLLLALILNESRKKYKIMLLIGLLLIASTLVLTASRGGVIAVIITGIIWLIFILKDKKLSKKTFKFTIIGLLIAAVVGVGLSGPISKLGVVERTTSTISFMIQGNIPDRVSWWLSSLEMIGDKPILGHGLSSFKDVYNKYRRSDYRVPGDVQDTITPESAHNEYLTIAATQGILGFLIYAAMVLAIFVYSIRAFKKADKKDKAYLLGLITAILVFYIQVSISFGTVMTLFFLYTLIGALISFIELDRKIFEEKAILFLRFVAFGAALCVFVFYGIFSLNSIRADYHFKQASIYASKGDLENTIENYELAEKLMPQIVEYYEGYADFLFELGIRMPGEMQEAFLIDAANIYEEAYVLNSNFPNISANMGLVHSRLADLLRDDEVRYNQHKARAEGYLLHAREYARNNPLYVYKTAQMFEFFKDYGQAYDFYQEVLEIRDPYKDTAEKILFLLQLDPGILEAIEKAKEEDKDTSRNSNVIHLDGSEELLPGEYTAE